MATALTHDGRLDIPTIDISAFREPDVDEDAKDEVAAALDLAARTVGFMQIVGHGIGADTIAAFTQATTAFFDLDLETKNRYRHPPGVNRGYSPPKSESLANSLGLASAADLFEAINIGTAQSEFPGVPLPPEHYPVNTFPVEVSGFEAAVTSWFDQAAAVARTMTRIFARALGLGDAYFETFTSHSIDTLRMINYRLPGADVELEPDQVGMGAHTDYGIVTVLWADQVPGLEILGGDRSWYPVQPAAGALLVNLGDALARWTYDRWISTMHRVAAPRIDGRLVPRRSAAFFHDGNADALIQCLPNCLDEGGVARYAPVTVAEHLSAKLAGSRAGELNPNATREAARLAR
jgi:isopenicillin N synthase-like dioxygenase